MKKLGFAYSIAELGIQVLQSWRGKLLKPAKIPTIGHAMFVPSKVAGFEIKSIEILDL
jgi:hypothetical protein